MFDSPVLSIVIVNWNVRDLLAQCLTSVANEPIAEASEILVVDNASRDGSVEMVRARFPNVRLIQNHENVGFARANNQAMRESCGKYILLLNPDTQVLDNALTTMVQFMEQHSAVGAVGPRLLNGDGSLQHGCYPLPTVGREFWRLFHLDKVLSLGSYSMKHWPTDCARSVEMMSGACLLLRREALDAVGPLSEDYFIYTEEVDLCYRMRQAGWQLMWIPQAQVIHYGGQSTRQVAADMFLQLYQSKIRYFRKHYGPSVAVVYKAVLAAASLARLGLTPLTLLEAAQQRERHRVLAVHYRLLLAALPDM